MKTRLLCVFAIVGLLLASPKSYAVKLFEPSIIGASELKPGDYKIELQNDKVVIRNGKALGEAAVKVETGDQKYADTTVRYSNGDGKYRITEIRLGGTNMKLVVNN